MPGAPRRSPDPRRGSGLRGAQRSPEGGRRPKLVTAELPWCGQSAGVPASPRRGATGSGDVLGDRDLLGLGGEVRTRSIGEPATARPGAEVELEATVVAVTGVDGPVAGRLALGDALPVDAAGTGRGRRGGAGGTAAGAARAAAGRAAARTAGRAARAAAGGL